jgi:hypothetical protein
MIKNITAIIPILILGDSSRIFAIIIIIMEMGSIQNNALAKRGSGARPNQKSKLIRMGIGTRKKHLFVFFGGKKI